MSTRIHKISANSGKCGISQAMKQERCFFQGQNTSGVGAVCLCMCVPKVSHSSSSTPLCQGSRSDFPAVFCPGQKVGHVTSRYSLTSGKFSSSVFYETV